MDITVAVLIIIISHSDLKIPLITPGGIPGVLYEKIVQASGFIMTIADNEHSVVYHVVFGIVWVTVGFVAISCINDTTRV